LIFTKCSKTKLDINPFPISAIDFENQKILVRSDQTESTKEKNIIIDDNAAPRMIKPKNPNVGVQNVDERKRKQAPRPKPTVKHMLDKYTTGKANKVFSRLGGIKHPRFPTRSGGHERWRENSQNQQPCFPVASTYWGCPPLTYPQFCPWGFNLWAPYPTGPLCYHQGEWIPSRRMFRPKLHEKRVRFNQKATSHDTTVIRGNRSLVEDVKNYKGGHKLMWVPVKHVEPKFVDGLDTAHGLKLGENQSVEGVVHNPKVCDGDGMGCGSLQTEVICTKEGSGNVIQLQQISSDQFEKDISSGLTLQNGGDIVPSSMSQKLVSVNACANAIMRSSSLKPFPSSSPGGFKSAGTSTQRGNSDSTRNQRVKANEQMVLSAKDRFFVPKAAVLQCRPGNWGAAKLSQSHKKLNQDVDGARQD
jgi:hypothetical protein